MKSTSSRSSSTPLRRSTTPLRRSTTPHSSYTFLKPGALAQIRYSKIAAKSRAKYATTLLALTQMHPDSSTDTTEAVVSMDEIPKFFSSFKNRCQPPRCLLRKKLVAVLPVFTES